MSSPPSSPPIRPTIELSSNSSPLSDESKRSKLSPQSPPSPSHIYTSPSPPPPPPSSPPPPFDSVMMNYQSNSVRQSQNSLYSSHASSNSSLSSSQSSRLSLVEIPQLSIKSGLTHSFENAFEWSLDVEKMLKSDFKQCSSPTFTMGPYQWSMFSSPNSLDSDFVSIYLKAMNGEQVSGTRNWSICCQFNLSLIFIDDSCNTNEGGEVFTQIEPNHQYQEGKLLFSKEFSHRFDQYEMDWGRPSFYSRRLMMDLKKEHRSSSKFVLICSMKLMIDETGILWHNFNNYDSKSITGYVGLANQGATCYMNSLLQSLFLTPAFIRSIYQIPTENLANPQDNSALALQRLFWRMQFEDSAVSTRELTRAFGWDSMTSFLQSDVQEFCRLLFENLEDQMKKTPAEGSIERIFVGKVRNVISCLNVDFRSTRTENFYDLQVAVRGCSCLEDSFKLYCEPEMMVGDNQYRADGFGLQDAKKFIEFESFPPVMHLQLERYAFCPRAMNTIKINDRLEFPLNIDITHCLAPDSPQRQENGATGPCSYTLQSVFVHSGDSHGGHYYVFVRDLCPTSPSHGKWCRFDDTTVTPATERQAVNDNFGGVDDAPSTPTQTPIRLSREERAKKFTNAYMLIYLKDSEIPSITKVIDPLKDIPFHIGTLLRKEKDRERRRIARRDDALRSITIGVLTSPLIQLFGGFDYFNFRNPNLPLTLGDSNSPSSSDLFHSVSRDTLLFTWKAELAKKMGISNVSLLKLRPFSLRRNQTIRMDVPFSDDNEAILTMGQVHAESLKNLGYSRYSSNRQKILHPAILYADVVTDVSLVYEPSIISILCKFYDPDHDSLTPLGLINVRFSDTLLEKEYMLCDMIGLPPTHKMFGSSDNSDYSAKSNAISLQESQLLYWEEVKPGKIQFLNPESTFKVLGYRYGDILTFQLAKPLLMLSDSMESSSLSSSSTSTSSSNPLSTLISSDTIYFDGDEKEALMEGWKRHLAKKILPNKSNYILGRKVTDYYKGIMNCILVKFILPTNPILPLLGEAILEWDEVDVRISLDSDWSLLVRMVAERLLLDPLDPPSNVQCLKLASYLRLGLIMPPSPSLQQQQQQLKISKESSDSEDSDDDGDGDGLRSSSMPPLPISASSMTLDFDEGRLIPLKVALESGIPPTSSKQTPTLRDVLSRCNREIFDVNNANPLSSIEILAQRSSIPITELDRKNRIRLLLISNPTPTLKSSPFVDDLFDGNSGLEKKWINVGLMDTMNSLKEDGKFDFLSYDKDSLIRMVEVYHSKLVREYLLDDSLSSLSFGHDSLNHGYNYYLEEVKKNSEEFSYYTNSSTSNLMITVFSYWQDLARPHSLPFRFSIIDGESMIDFLKRLLKRMSANEDFGSISNEKALENNTSDLYKIVRDEEWKFNLTSVGKLMEFATFKTLNMKISSPIMIGEESLHHVLKEYEDTVEIAINRPDPSLEQRGVGVGAVVGERSIKMRSSSNPTLK